MAWLKDLIKAQNWRYWWDDEVDDWRFDTIFIIAVIAVFIGVFLLGGWIL